MFPAEIRERGMRFEEVVKFATPKPLADVTRD
jgi:hypothetical protein